MSIFTILFVILLLAWILGWGVFHRTVADPCAANLDVWPGGSTEEQGFAGTCAVASVAG